MSSDAFDPNTKKYLTFDDRTITLFGKKERQLFDNHYTEIVKNSLIGKLLFWCCSYDEVLSYFMYLFVYPVFFFSLYHIAMNTGSAMQLFAMMACSYYAAAIMFSWLHMGIHSITLDYHWSGVQQLYSVFGYFHHFKTRDTFRNQIFTTFFGTTDKKRGWPLVYQVLHGMVFVYVMHDTHARLIWCHWFVWWVLQAASHAYAHREKSLPTVFYYFMAGLDMLHLLPSHESHKMHHNHDSETKYCNFSDLNTPTLDKITNYYWDSMFKKYFHLGKMSEQMTGSSIKTSFGSFCIIYVYLLLSAYILDVPSVNTWILVWYIGFLGAGFAVINQLLYARKMMKKII